MDERELVSAREADWSRLDAIVAKAWSGAGVRTLSAEEVRVFGPLYRRTATDLAYARSHRLAAPLVSRLNGLVGRAHALLYQTDARRWPGLLGFFGRDFPATFRRRIGYFLAAAGLLLLGAGVGYALVASDRANIDIFVPPGSEFRQSLRHWESGRVSQPIPDAAGAASSIWLITHNVQVSFVAFALGIVGGVLTALVLFTNGAMLGAFAGMMTHAHQHASFWPGILPHAVVELTVTCIAGGAGLALGWALLAPGACRRRDALVLAAADSVRLVVGGAVLLVFAGLVEAFVSHSPLPAPARVLFGAVSGVVLYAYLLLAGRDGVTTAGAPSPRGSG